MKVAVIDVGSHTARLLVAASRPEGLRRIHEAKTYLGLGAEALRYGVIGDDKLAEAAAAVRHYADLARRAGAARVVAVVTAPARHAANGDELVDRLRRATGVLVRPLTAVEEGVLAYRGAVAAAGHVRGAVAVCDVGGASTEVVVGAPPAPPVWARSLDVGALSLARRFIRADPPAGAELAAIMRHVAAAFEALLPPRPHAALAAGGTARALAWVAGGRFGEAELMQALRLVASRRAVKLARTFGIDVERARVLGPGTIILLEATRRLGVPLEPARGGLREAVASELVAELAAA